MAHPEEARVFIVGFNQATGFPATMVGSHDDYIDALFNRSDRSCQKLYEQMRGDDGASPTRRNLDRLRAQPAREGVHDVVETNVICYSTPMSRDLTEEKNKGGRAAGRQIFEEVLAIVRPRILIAHGAATAKELGRVLCARLPPAATNQAGGVSRDRVQTSLRGHGYAPIVFAIQSLAPPRWNAWAEVGGTAPCRDVHTGT